MLAIYFRAIYLLFVRHFINFVRLFNNFVRLSINFVRLFSNFGNGKTVRHFTNFVRGITNFDRLLTKFVRPIIITEREVPQCTFIHCILHKKALAAKNIQPELHETLNLVIKVVNFVKSRTLNERILRKLCEERMPPFFPIQMFAGLVGENP